MTEIQGYTARGFEGVRDAFAANFDNGSEVGAAFSAYHRGQKVVDLWGGVADQATGAAWQEDTMILVFSTTKGATALCANRLAERGELDVEAPVATYWPEFAAAGKEDMPVSYVLSHQAGLAWIDGTMTLEEALSWDPVVERLAAEAPKWEPGTATGYHAVTYGWLVGEVVKRISGKSLGTFFHDEVAGPLGADWYVGLPEELDHRVAPLIVIEAPTDEAVKAMMDQFTGPDTKLGKALSAPGGAFSDIGVFNSRAVRAAEIPAANGVADARSIARVYASMVGEVDGVRTLSADQVKQATTQRSSGPNIVLLDMDVQFGLGFMVPSTLIVNPAGSFGHYGAGGSVGWADPDAELGFGYVMNRMDIGLAGDLRSASLINATYASI
ncbi:MAG: serine hydrolase domain-containing protein [Acidimicrobiales bacterium]